MQQPQVSTRVRLVYCSVLMLLAGQSLFIRYFGEPYPALKMPTFSGSGGYEDGRFKFSRYDAVFLAEGKEYSFPQSVLLAEFPAGYQGTISQKSLRPPSSKTAVSSTGMLKRIRDTVFPGNADRSQSPENKASLQDWLRRRGQVLVPNKKVSRVEFRWFTETWSRNGNWVAGEREPTGTLVIALEGESR